MLKAIKNKQTELIVSLGMVLALLMGASIIMYLLEHNAQPKSFTSIYDSLWWGVDKYLTTIGVEDVNPITPAGKFLGGLIAILGVGMFALPAGIVASGFIEEIENKKQLKELVKQESEIKYAFFIEYFVPVKNKKKSLNLPHLPRKWLSLEDIKYKMFISESSVLKVCQFSKFFRLRNVKLEGVSIAGLEYVNINRTYGQCINRNSNLTIINLYPSIQPYFGHFSMAIADILQANYISNEVFSPVSFLEENQLNMVINNSYIEETDSHPAISQLKKDITALIEKDSTCVFMVNAGANEYLMQFNIGSEKGDESFENGILFSDKEKLNEYFNRANAISNIYEKKTSKHGKVGNPVSEHVSHFIRTKTNCDLLMLHINVEILKKNDVDYYQHISEFASVFAEKKEVL